MNNQQHSVPVSAMGLGILELFAHIEAHEWDQAEELLHDLCGEGGDYSPEEQRQIETASRLIINAQSGEESIFG